MFLPNYYLIKCKTLDKYSKKIRVPSLSPKNNYLVLMASKELKGLLLNYLLYGINKKLPSPSETLGYSSTGTRASSATYKSGL